ncbi:MAG: hypothetical protein RQ751_11875 [Longimicrobiales bacterium]|nr:hypothetical protein [Longimicrobiales bacterium]
MNDPQRYDDEAVARILELATRDEPAPGGARREVGAAERGLTLAEIQEIGREVGIAPERIAEGARTLALAAAPYEVRGRMVGFPISVGGATELPRDLTDTEWERLVARMRMVFNAHGKLERSGGLRSWRNGNLRIQLEPTEGGQRLHMQTHRRQSMMFAGFGGTFLGVSAVLAVIGAVGGGVDGDLVSLAVVGSGFLAAGLAPLRGWAKRRREQMRALAAEAVEMASRALPGG